MPLDYDPVNNVFVFLTDLRSGQRTWAFRFSSTHGANVAASRAAPPPWPGNAICPNGPRLPSRARPDPPPTQLGRPLRQDWRHGRNRRRYLPGRRRRVDARVISPSGVSVGGRILTRPGDRGGERSGDQGPPHDNREYRVLRRGRWTTECAAIRQEGTRSHRPPLLFHHSQEGILTGADPDSEILIEYSSFLTTGSTTAEPQHIRRCGQETYDPFSYIHHARVGHNIKSRLGRRWSSTTGSWMKRTATRATRWTSPTGAAPT